jgi:hypothetical protein
MQDRVTIWANRPQILDWVHNVFATDLRQRANVVDVYVPFGFSSVNRPETEATDAADRSVGSNTLTAGLQVSFVGVDHDGSNRAFDQSDRTNLFR